MLRRVFLSTQEIHVIKNVLTDRIFQELEHKDSLHEDILTLRRICQALHNNSEMHGHQRRDLDQFDSAFDWE